MAYLLLLVIIGVTVYVSWRVARAGDNRPKTRVIGPDDDPEFLSRLRRGDDHRNDGSQL